MNVCSELCEDRDVCSESVDGSQDDAGSEFINELVDVRQVSLQESVMGDGGLRMTPFSDSRQMKVVEELVKAEVGGNDQVVAGEGRQTRFVAAADAEETCAVVPRPWLVDSVICMGPGVLMLSDSVGADCLSLENRVTNGLGAGATFQVGGETSSSDQWFCGKMSNHWFLDRLWLIDHEDNRCKRDWSLID